MIASPKVSIIIPVYNGSNFLEEAIDSALAQTYENVEIVIVNDGSTDNNATEKIALSYQDKIRYFYKENGGVSSALNLGISRMTGEYFSWLSHDDVYKPDKLKRQIQFLRQQEQDGAILYGDYELINEKTKVLDEIILSNQYPVRQLNKSLFPVYRGLINGCTLLIPKAQFDRVGMFDESLRTTQDYDLWFRMFREAPVKYCPGSLIQSRVHAHQTSKMKAHTAECDELWIKLLNEITEEEMISLEGTPFEFLYNTSLHLRRHSNYVKAEEYAMQLATQYSAVRNRRKLFQLPKFQGSKKFLLRRFVSNVKTEGLITTLRKVVRKLH